MVLREKDDRSGFRRSKVDVFDGFNGMCGDWEVVVDESAACGVGSRDGLMKRGTLPEDEAGRAQSRGEAGGDGIGG